MCETIVTYFCKFTIIDVHVVSLNFCNIFINYLLCPFLFGIFTLFLINISKHYQIRGGIFRPCLSVRTSYLDIIHVNSDLPLWGIGIKIIGSVTYLLDVHVVSLNFCNIFINYLLCPFNSDPSHRPNNLSLVCLYLSLYISFLLFGIFFCQCGKKKKKNYLSLQNHTLFIRGSHGHDLSWIYNYLYLSPLTLWVQTLLRRGVLNTILCDKSFIFLFNQFIYT
jgi:hypothetical protein